VTIPVTDSSPWSDEVDTDIALEGSGLLAEVTVAYETWGELSPARSNAILVLHALTLDSHAAGAGSAPAIRRPVGGTVLIGSGAPLDTERYFVVCPNVLGGCQGTTGPSSLAPDGAPYGSRFPLVTIRDQVAAEVALADQLGIAQLGGRHRGLDGRHAGTRVVRRLPRPPQSGRRPGRRSGGHRRRDRLVLSPDTRHPLRPRVRRR
jgi:hypothetical protein